MKRINGKWTARMDTVMVWCGEERAVCESEAVTCSHSHIRPQAMGCDNNNDVFIVGPFFQSFVSMLISNILCMNP